MQLDQYRERWWRPRVSSREVLTISLGLGVISALVLISVHVLHGSPLAGLTWQGWLTIGVTIAAFLANALTALPAEIVFLGCLSVLFLTGILDEQGSLAGFSNPGMVTVGVLYIVVTGLQQTGGLAWISQQVLGLPKGATRALLRMMPPVIGLSALLNNTPVVAMFIPVVNDWSRKLGVSPSKLMIPLSYSAIFGGICTLVGTSTNLVVNGLLITQTENPGLNLLDITPVGLPCALAGTLYLILAQKWLLPERKPALSEADDPRQYTVEMVVSPGGPLVDKTVEQAGLRQLPGLYLVEITRAHQVVPAVSPREILREADQLVFVGVIDSIVDLHRLRGLQPATDQVFKLDAPRTERCLIEAVVSNTCPLVGKTIREGKFRTQYNAVVLAVARNGERLPGKMGNISLRPGDTLLLEAHPSFLDQRKGSRDFYLVSGIPDSSPLDHEKAPVAMGILVIMVVLASFGWLSMLKAAILAAVLMLVAQCCSTVQALRSIEWSVLLVIGAALGIGQALQSTGAAEALASTFMGVAGQDPWVALSGIYVITAILTEIITNNAAAALVFPIAIALSERLDVSVMPFIIVIMIAASASFVTPIGYQTNLMVYGPGGYRFTDFTRLGLPLAFIFCLITVILTPVFYPF